MKKESRGFGLIEVMVALVLGLLVVLGVTQIFVSAKQTYQVQDSSAKLQEDARFLLTRLTQDIRMAGMFGCLSLSSGSVSGTVPSGFSQPIDWDDSTKTLTLYTSVVGGAAADWKIVTDCSGSAEIKQGTEAVTLAGGQILLPIRKIEYVYDSNSKVLYIVAGGVKQPLISGVDAFNVSFGLAADAASDYASGSYVTTVANSSLIRSVRLQVTLADPTGKARSQMYSAVAAVRNRIP